tara:strand:+ start:343 stop:612 length:270 start_codon:yes stop_codon:yes gene_type:complete
LAEHRSPKPGVRGSTPFSPAKFKEKMVKWIGSIKQFVKEVKNELIKCSWPTKKELYGQSVVVIVAVILLGVFIAVCDRINFSLLDLIIR